MIICSYWKPKSFNTQKILLYYLVHMYFFVSLKGWKNQLTNCICRELQHFGTIYIAVVTEYLTQDMRLVPSWWVRSGCQINGSTREVKSSDDPAVLIWTNSIDYSGLRKSYKNSREHVCVNCFVVFRVFVILVFWTVPCFFFNIDNWLCHWRRKYPSLLTCLSLHLIHTRQIWKLAGFLKRKKEKLWNFQLNFNLLNSWHLHVCDKC